MRGMSSLANAMLASQAAATAVQAFERTELLRQHVGLLDARLRAAAERAVVAVQALGQRQPGAQGVFGCQASCAFSSSITVLAASS